MGHLRRGRNHAMSRDHETGRPPIIEPEIIPPDRRDGRSTYRSRTWIADGARGSQRIYVAKLGPFGAISAALFALLLGAFLIGTLAIGAIVAFAMIAGLLRRLARPQR